MSRGELYEALDLQQEKEMTLCCWPDRLSLGTFGGWRLAWGGFCRTRRQRFNILKTY